MRPLNLCLLWAGVRGVCSSSALFLRRSLLLVILAGFLGPGPSAAWAQPKHFTEALPVKATPRVQILKEYGCIDCHSLDGRAGPGPTFQGLAGSRRKVSSGGRIKVLPADEAYLKRAIQVPDADVVVGFKPGRMPSLQPPETTLTHLVEAIASLPDALEEEPVEDGSLLQLALGMVAFVGLHFLLSSPPVRSRLVAALSERVFQVAYSILVLAALWWAWEAWEKAPYVELWSAPLWTRHIPLVVMPLVCIFWVAGYATPDLGTGKVTPEVEGAPGEQQPLQGLQAVTRHPALWGWATWSLVHLPSNGELAAVLLFGGFAILAFGGMAHIDWRRRQSLGPERWEALYGRTSLVPFVAMVEGRASFSLAQVESGHIPAGLGLYVVMLLGAHRWMMGVSPLPL